MSVLFILIQGFQRYAMNQAQSIHVSLPRNPSIPGCLLSPLKPGTATTLDGKREREEDDEPPKPDIDRRSGEFG